MRVEHIWANNSASTGCLQDLFCVQLDGNYVVYMCNHVLYTFEGTSRKCRLHLVGLATSRPLLIKRWNLQPGRNYGKDFIKSNPVYKRRHSLGSSRRHAILFLHVPDKRRLRDEIKECVLEVTSIIVSICAVDTYSTISSFHCNFIVRVHKSFAESIESIFSPVWLV